MVLGCNTTCWCSSAEDVRLRIRWPRDFRLRRSEMNTASQRKEIGCILESRGLKSFSSNEFTSVRQSLEIERVLSCCGLAEVAVDIGRPMRIPPSSCSTNGPAQKQELEYLQGSHFFFEHRCFPTWCTFRTGYHRVYGIERRSTTPAGNYTNALSAARPRTQQCLCAPGLIILFG
jgi:hypothetical protein